MKGNIQTRTRRTLSLLLLTFMTTGCEYVYSTAMLPLCVPVSIAAMKPIRCFAIDPWPEQKPRQLAMDSSATTKQYVEARTTVEPSLPTPQSAARDVHRVASAARTDTERLPITSPTLARHTYGPVRDMW